ncbi:transposase, partial [Streptococcus pneumoniae]|nr:transposase [Streptococcus pneumoniae]
DHFFDLLTEAFPQLNQAFRTALSTLVRYRKYVTNAIQMPYSNSKLEAINKLISFLQTQTCRYGYVFLQILEFSQR